MATGSHVLLLRSGHSKSGGRVGEAGRRSGRKGGGINAVNNSVAHRHVWSVCPVVVSGTQVTPRAPRHALVLRGRENIGVKTVVVERSGCAWQGQEGGRYSQRRRGRDRHRERGRMATGEMVVELGFPPFFIYLTS